MKKKSKPRGRSVKGTHYHFNELRPLRRLLKHARVKPSCCRRCGATVALIREDAASPWYPVDAYYRCGAWWAKIGLQHKHRCK
jgi:hypothetical protein